MSADRPDGTIWFAEHEGAVTCVAVSSEGTRLASGSVDRTVRVWDAATGAALAVLRGHEGEVTDVAFSLDSGRVVSAATDRTARVWDIGTGTELSCLRVTDPGVWSRIWRADGPAEEIHAFGAVAFAPDGQQIVTQSDGNRLRVWNPVTKECISTVEGVTDFQAFAACETWVAFLRGNVLEVEDSRTGTIVARTPAPRTLGGRGPVITRPGGTAWAHVADRWLYFWSFREGSAKASTDTLY